MQHTDIASDALEYAMKNGAEEASIKLSTGSGFSVVSQNQAIDLVEQFNDQSFSISIYIGKAIGSASTNDFSEEQLRMTIEKALSLSRLTEKDDCNGLAEKDLMATEVKDLELYQPSGLTIKQAQEMAIECEGAAFDVNDLVVNSEGATVGSYESHSVYLNSHGFIGETESTGHNVSCVAIAQKDGQMEMDYDYSSTRGLDDLSDPVSIGQSAGNRAVSNLGSRKLKTQKAPVLLSPRISKSLISHLLNAISGTSLYRKSSFLVDKIDEKILPSFVQIYEDPHLKRGFSSTYFDGEGVQTNPRGLIEDGHLRGYLLSSYSARRLGLETTANAGGHHNIIVQNSVDEDLNSIIKDMKYGFLVTGFIGSGVNIVNGDYSRGANGFWVENGEIAYPVNEVTVAGNLTDMFSKIQKIGNDPETDGSVFCGTVLIDELMIAGE
ncbi:MAG: metalloprotease PmbA [Gammaproteobacteria bacterium]|nr:metalloprotease PmbA [Gammaproteobacteria bacterium]HJM99936.1 metalloprotease PmbA [Gammaproteobacteria bacterium]